MKGGEDYFYPLGEAGRSKEALNELFAYFRKEVEWSDVGSRQYVVDWCVVEDDFLTDFERSQLEFDGYVAYPTKVLQIKSDEVYYGA